MTLLFKALITFYIIYFILNINNAYLLRENYDDVVPDLLEKSASKRKLKDEIIGSKTTVQNKNVPVQNKAKKDSNSKVSTSKNNSDRSKKSNNDKTTAKITTTATKRNTETVWEPWTLWSTCSVTCGKGRNIRWRHCKTGCGEAETEMEEKICQMPACPQKLFGLINL